VAGRYLLEGVVSWGGMGVVWRAKDVLIGRAVAVKELRAPAGCSAEDREQFEKRSLREARAAGQIAHPGVVDIYDVVPIPKDDDAIYLVMELVEAPDLAAVIAREGSLDESRVINIGLQVLAALDAAHALGVVHRDIKPGNIMLLDGDQVKLVDFGIAQAQDESRMTRSGVMGTHAYMAPELFEDNPITPAVDLWSLGATLFHAVEGVGPFQRDSYGATLRAIVLDDIPMPHCGSPLKEAITALLTREPGRRASSSRARALLESADEPPKDVSQDDDTTKNPKSPRNPRNPRPPVSGDSSR
jgi:serine/threonine protein kinase